MSEVAAIASESLRTIPTALRQLVDIGIQARDVGLHAQAGAIFRHIVARNPRSGFGHYELAILHLLQGEHVDALLAVQAMRAYLPRDVRAAVLAVRLLIALGGHAEAAHALGELQSLDPENADLPWLEELNRFVARFPGGMAQLLTRRIEQSDHYLDTTAVHQRLGRALREQRGFSLIRLGDGEGAFCRVSDDDEAEYRHLYRRSRADRARVWFDGQIDLEASGFTRLALTLREVIQAADIVGLPYASWVEHEYRIQSATGMTSLVNALRVATEGVGATEQCYCRQTIHTRLLKSGAIEALVRTQQRIGLISCHPALPDLLRRRFGLGEVVFHKIPGEKLFEARIGADASAGVHFPDRFEEVMAALRRPLGGLLVLVAAGILGKFYCARIKQSGGIALDIGSLADAWMGANTRPGYDALDAALGARDAEAGRGDAREDRGRAAPEGAGTA